MKQIVLLFFTLNIYFCFSQTEPTSLYFGSGLEDTINKHATFDQKMVGNYTVSADGYNQLIITPDSIYLRSGTPVIMSIKESKKKGFTIKDEKLFGLDKNKGLHCKVVNDTVFTIYYQEDRYFNKLRGDLMMKLNDGYLLCIKESNQLYSYFYIQRKSDEIQIKSIDHTTQMNLVYQFSTLQSQYIGGIKTYIVKPSIDEMQHFIKQDGFNETTVFKLVSTLN